MKRLNKYEIVIEQVVRRTVVSKAHSAEIMRNLINDYGVAEVFTDWPDDQSKKQNAVRIVTIVRAKT